MHRYHALQVLQMLVLLVINITKVYIWHRTNNTETHANIHLLHDPLLGIFLSIRDVFGSNPYSYMLYFESWLVIAILHIGDLAKGMELIAPLVTLQRREAWNPSSEYHTERPWVLGWPWHVWVKTTFWSFVKDRVSGSLVITRQEKRKGKKGVQGKVEPNAYRMCYMGYSLFILLKSCFVTCLETIFPWAWLFDSRKRNSVISSWRWPFALWCGFII